MPRRNREGQFIEVPKLAPGNKVIGMPPLGGVRVRGKEVPEMSSDGHRRPHLAERVCTCLAGN